MAASSELNLIIGVTDRASSALGGIADKLGKVGTIAGGLALGGIAAIGTGLGAVALEGLGFNSALEQAEAKIDAFTKDADKTAEILDMVRERAEKTPFAFEEMADAAAALGPAARQSGVPLDNLIGQAEILAASNPAEGLEGGVVALKEALSGDFTSIVERFNLPRQRLNELKEQGVPALEAVQTAMKEMGLDADLVGNMANTMQGRWSTFKDTLTGLAGTATAPLFEGLSSGLGTLQTKINENLPQIEAFAKAVGEGLGAAFSWLIDTGLPALQTAFQTVWPIIQTAVSTVFTFLSETVWPWLRDTAFPWLTDTGLPALQTAFETVWPKIKTAVETAYTFLSETVWPWLRDTAWPWLKDEALPALQTAFETVWPKIQTAVKTVYAFFSETVWPWLRDTAWPWLKDEALPALQTAFETVWPIIQTAVETVYTFFHDVVWPWLQEAFRNTTEKEIPAIKKAFEDNWPKIEAAVRTVYNFFHDVVWPWLSENIPKIAEYVEGVQGRWDTAWQTISNAVTTAKNTISGIIDEIKSIVQGAINRINELITLINKIPGVEIPNIPSIPGTGGSGSSGANSIGNRVPLGLPGLGSSAGRHTTNSINVTINTNDRREVELGLRDALAAAGMLG